ncbi:hypothetical protein A3D88_03175 [Candidatus Peribacteria bacterium RIFCSPHIGHO2_02_FULL_52_16]|nr:MAG: hypothetical protein A2706_03995 [Candidatus Peribacteria bacterium RIFCSPHIGHO2_01_FULL_51_35]OGJ61334.1 MAG: hypothetical protein A3D88_03175 [Candidatus Peribacteria bacterium RIFCSPHIGHO2_02_FULL_52_16]
MNPRRNIGVVVFGLLTFLLTFSVLSFWNRPAPLQGQFGQCSNGTPAVAALGGSGNTPSNSEFMAKGDFNNDSLLDMALGGGSIFLGYGNGNFVRSDLLPLASISIGGSNQFHGGAVADFETADITGDGNSDVVMTYGQFGNESVDTRVILFAGNGNGTFDHEPFFLAEADNGGDLIIGNFDGNSALDIFVGEKTQVQNGTFIFNYRDNFNPSNHGIPNPGNGLQGPISVRAATSGDFNNDGKTDLAGSGLSDKVALQENFTWNVADLGGGFGDIASGNLDNDGDMDIVAGRAYLNNGQGAFTPAGNIPVGSVNLMDFNGGPIDVAGYRNSPFPFFHATIDIHGGVGNGTFQSTPDGIISFLPQGAMDIETGNFDQDGREDVAVYFGANNFQNNDNLPESFRVYVQTPPGGFSEDQNGGPFTGLACSGTARCGDGILQSQNSLEQCDDGNTVDGDDCNNSCRGIQTGSSSSDFFSSVFDTSSTGSANSTATSQGGGGGDGSCTASLGICEGDVEAALGADGLPVIAYVVGSFTGTNEGIFVMKCGNAECTSGNVSTKVQSITTPRDVYQLHIAVPPDGRPFIEYIHAGSRELRAIKCGNASCTGGNIATTIDTDARDYSSLAVGQDGLPVISYTKTDNSKLKVLKCGNASCASGNTTTEVTSQLQQVIYTAIAVPDSGNPLVVINNMVGMRMIRCGNASCSTGNTESVISLQGDNVRSEMLMIIGQDGFPRITFSGEGHEKFLKCGNLTCSSGNNIAELHDRFSHSHFINSLVMPNDGQPIVGFNTASDNVQYDDIAVLKCGNPLCNSGNTIEDYDTGPGAGALQGSTSLILGADDLPFIAYYDYVTSTLRTLKCGNATCSQSCQVGNGSSTGNNSSADDESSSSDSSLDGDSCPADFSKTTVEAAEDAGFENAIAVPADGRPVISYHHTISPEGGFSSRFLKLMKCGNPSCTTGNTSAILATSQSIGESALALGTDGFPIVAFNDVNDFGLSVLNLAKCGDAACTIVNAFAVETGAEFPSIVVPADGKPVIAYHGTLDDSLKIVKCGNASCSSGNVTTVVDTGGTGNHTSIAIGSDGLPVVSYASSDVTAGSLFFVKCGNASCSAGNVIQKLDTAPANIGFTSIKVAFDGKPIISYTFYNSITDPDLKVVKCGNATCSTGNTRTIIDATDTVGEFTSIVIPADGLPMISYKLVTNTFAANSSLKVVKCTNANCTGGARTVLDNIVSNSQVAHGTSIAVSADGFPVISYYVGGALQDLKVIKCGNATCNPICQASVSTSSLSSSSSSAPLSASSSSAPSSTVSSSTPSSVAVLSSSHASSVVSSAVILASSTPSSAGGVAFVSSSKVLPAIPSSVPASAARAAVSSLPSFIPSSAIALAPSLPTQPGSAPPRIPTLVRTTSSVSFSALTVQPTIASGQSSAGVEEQVLGLFVDTGLDRAAAPSVTSAPTPTQICGDGTREGSEECDDGNNRPADGCSETCRTEIRMVTANGEVIYMPPAATSYDLTGDILAPQQQAGAEAPSAPRPPQTTDSGPAAIAVMAAGAAAGFGWMRRRKNK